MINMISISTNHRAQPPGISTNESEAVFIFIYLLISFLCKVLHPLSYQGRRPNVVKNIFPQEICFVSRQQYNLSYTLHMKWILHLADRDDTWIQKRQWQNSVHNYKRFFSHYFKRSPGCHHVCWECLVSQTENTWCWSPPGRTLCTQLVPAGPLGKDYQSQSLLYTRYIRAALSLVRSLSTNESTVMLELDQWGSSLDISLLCRPRPLPSSYSPCEHHLYTPLLLHLLSQHQPGIIRYVQTLLSLVESLIVLKYFQSVASSALIKYQL